MDGGEGEGVSSFRVPRRNHVALDALTHKQWPVSLHLQVQQHKPSLRFSLLVERSNGSESNR